MNLSTVIARMPLYYRAGLLAIEHPDRFPAGEDNPASVYFRSPPGRGKTTAAKAAPAIISKAMGKNIGFVLLNGGMLTEMDLMGYLTPVHKETFSDSRFTTPFFWVTSEGKRLEDYDGGIIFVDEEDKAPVEVKKCLGEGRLSGRFGPHTLPPGWVVWGAGNRSSDRSGSTKELDHLIRRRMQIDVTDDVPSWVDWASKNHISMLTMSFVEAHPAEVFTDGVPTKQGPWCTPAAIVHVDRWLSIVHPDGNIPENDVTLIEEVAGKIGDAAAASYFTHVKLEIQMPKFETIVAKPKEVKVPTAADARMLVCYNLAHRVTEKTADAVITYIERMPKEFAVTFARAACQKNAALALTPAFDKWTMANSSLMAAITR